MALLTCTECGGTVSDKAECCPHCGCPISAIVHSADSGRLTDAVGNNECVLQNQEVHMPAETSGISPDSLSEEEEELRLEALEEMCAEAEEAIDPSVLCDMICEDDPFDDPFFNWVQFMNGGISPSIANKDEFDEYDMEDMGLDPNFYSGDWNNF